MRNLFRGTKALAVTFCARRGEVCDAGCRREAPRHRSLFQHVWLEVRV